MHSSALSFINVVQIIYVDFSTKQTLNNVVQMKHFSSSLRLILSQNQSLNGLS